MKSGEIWGNMLGNMLGNILGNMLGKMVINMVINHHESWETMINRPTLFVGVRSGDDLAELVEPVGRIVQIGGEMNPGVFSEMETVVLMGI